MRTLPRIAVWAGGLMLILGGRAWSQDSACAIPPCMTPIFAQPAAVPNSRGASPVSEQRSGTSQRPSSPTGSSPAPSMPPTMSPTLSPGMTPADTNGPLNPQLEQEQSRLRNTDRQKQLVTDTQKLLALANQLKADVDKSNKDMLSIDVIKKAEEIEKLAHQVKEKMKGS